MSLFEAFKQALKTVFKFDANNNLKTTIASDEVNIAKESTLSSIRSQLDIKLSELRDALKGADNKDFSTLEADVEAILSQLDVALSTRASESTLAGIKAQTDKLQFDSKNYLKTSPRVQLEVQDEVVEAGEVLYIPSGVEVAFNNLTVKGTLIVSGKCVILKSFTLDEFGNIILTETGEVVVYG